MRLRFAAAIAAAALLLSTRGVRGDSMVVAGVRAEARVPFVVSGDEVYAPLLPALAPLGVQWQVTSDAVKLTTGARREILVSRVRPEATRDGVLREMPGVPLMRNGSALLPARAVGSLLGCAVRWDQPSRTLFLHPWVREFSLETLPDRYRIIVGAEGPFTYRAGRVEEGGPKLFVDLFGVDLSDIPSEIRLEGSYLRVARIAQRTLAPASEGEVTRLVVELDDWVPYRVKLSDDRHSLQVDFPLPGARELPPDAPPVVLSRLGFLRLSPRVAAVRVATFGDAVCQSGASSDPPAVWVDLMNAENRIAGPALEVKDKLVSGVSLGPAPGKPGAQRLSISLSAPVEHRVVSDRGGVRVLLGQFELSDVCVVVDPGHGGPDTGAIGRSGLTEKETNLDIALRVRRLLEAAGARVLMTRTDDSACIPYNRANREEHRAELLARCAVANEGGADLFVSVHANARETNPQSVRGTETYYRKQDSAAFAQVMQEEVVRAVGLSDGGVKYHPKPIIVLYQTRMPAALVEVGYLSNRADEERLADPAFREQAAIGIVNGVKRWVTEGNVAAGWATRDSAGDSAGAVDPDGGGVIASPQGGDR